MQNVKQQEWARKKRNTKAENNLTADHKLLPNQQKTRTESLLHDVLNKRNVTSTFSY